MQKVSFSEILKTIELSTTQRERAKELYTNLCRAIQDKGLDIDFYPQGSFATKTAVKPLNKGKGQFYDVDVICEFQDVRKGDTSAQQLMRTLESVVKEVADSKSLKVDVCDRCITVKYADDPTGASFAIDLIPAVAETAEVISDLTDVTLRSDLVGTSIAIGGSNDWITNNPHGYKEWFDEMVQGFERSYFQRRNLVEASIEQLPEDQMPTNMIRNVIKVLKRHRDVFYYQNHLTTTSPSIIITTTVGQLSSRLAPYNDEPGLFTAIVEQLYAVATYDQEGLRYATQYADLPISGFLMKTQQGWIFRNPTNGLDNIVSSWNENSTAAQEFFRWLRSLKKMALRINEDWPTGEVRSMFQEGLQVPVVGSTRPNYDSRELSTKPWRHE
ncbi:nucleotidyltransferase [Schleiferilactobacillus harbinensis]|uniref:nucleotidyltransferase domain-containing protein n=1 Tax=Schleiferilactobacillus harbinensis TaxID=304207 RepID=UPI0039EAC313